LIIWLLVDYKDGDGDRAKVRFIFIEGGTLAHRTTMDPGQDKGLGLSTRTANGTVTKG